MSRKNIFLGAAIAAFAALACIGVMGSAGSGLPAGVVLQPYGIAPELLIANMTAHLDNTLLFFSGDTLFPLSYALVFVGLYAATVEHNKLFALIGISAGLLTMLFDVVENSIFVTYALMLYNGATVTDPAVVPLYILTTLKWTMAFLTFYSFGLVFLRGTTNEKILAVVMLLFPIGGAVTTASPELIPSRGVFLVGGMLLFGLYFVYRYRIEPSN